MFDCRQSALIEPNREILLISLRRRERIFVPRMFVNESSISYRFARTTSADHFPIGGQCRLSK